MFFFFFFFCCCFFFLYKWGLSSCKSWVICITVLLLLKRKKRAESTMKTKRKLRSIDRCECIPGTFVSILHFPSTGRKQWGGEEKKKESGVIPFWIQHSGKTHWSCAFGVAVRANQHWIRAMMNGRTPETLGSLWLKWQSLEWMGPKCVNGCCFVFFLFSFFLCEIHNRCVRVCVSERKKERERERERERESERDG